jgi:hypothetical protein
MRALATVLITFGAMVLATGCFEGKGEFTFNPDGTGKIVGDVTFRPVAPWTGPKKIPPKAGATTPTTPPAVPAKPAKTPEEEMKDVVGQIVKKSAGIEAWKDVSFERLSDGRIHFQGTAYFKDLSKVRIYPDDTSGISFGSDGGSALMLVLSRAKDAAAKGSAGSMRPEEIAKRMKATRESYQRARAEVAMEINDMKIELVFHLPGTVSEMKGLQEKDGVLVLATDGMKILKAFDALISDNAFMAPLIASGKTFADSATTLDDAVDRKIFGQKGECWARVTGPTRAKFNYEAEMEAAKKAQPDMMVTLGLEVPKPVKAAPAKAATPAPTKAATPPPAKGAASPKASVDGPAGKIPSVPMPDPTKIPVLVMPF